MRIVFFLLLISVATLFADPQKPPPISVVRKQLKQAEIQFQDAKKIFNPWYSGPLLTGSAHMMPPGYANIQPYLFVNDNFAAYQSNRSSRSNPNDLFVVNPLSIFQFGIWHGLDMVITFGGIHQWQNNVSSGGYSDTPVQLGIRILQEGPYVPAMKLYINESFPTGKFRNSDPSKNGLDITGTGSYLTSVSLNSSKVVWWIFDHPMSLRISLGYDLYPSKVSVRGINAYGGAVDTRGRVTPGRNIKVSFGYEGSITQRWVFAMDVAYTYTNKSTFSGFPGTLPDGSPASVGTQSKDVIIVAPAIEYNTGPNFGLLGGFQVTVYGRNTSNFIGGIFTLQYTFP